MCIRCDGVPAEAGGGPPVLQRLPGRPRFQASLTSTAIQLTSSAEASKRCYGLTIIC